MMELKKVQSRLRSKAAWAATLALLVFILKQYFNIEIPNVDILIDLILAALAGFGLWNDPTNGEGF